MYAPYSQMVQKIILYMCVNIYTDRKGVRKGEREKAKERETRN